MKHVPAFDLNDALQVFDHLPAGMIAHEVRGHAGAPLVRPGETAVADPRDRTLVSGHIYIVRWSLSVGIGRANFRKSFGRTPCWMFDPVALPRSDTELDRRLHAGTAVLSDGPYEADHLASKLLGRVVGVLMPSPDLIALPPPAALDAVFVAA